MVKNDLISRSALTDYLKKTKLDEVFPNWKELGCVAKTAILRLIKQYRVIVLNAPAVDAVEVVRCGNCIHRVYKEIGDCEIGGCELLGVALPCDFYCAEGERRVENGK